MPVDAVTAFEYLTRAADDYTHERGCAALGQCYTYGWGTQQNYAKALRYYRCAASGYYGDALAQYEIGLMYGPLVVFGGGRGDDDAVPSSMQTHDSLRVILREDALRPCPLLVTAMHTLYCVPSGIYTNAACRPTTAKR